MNKEIVKEVNNRSNGACEVCGSVDNNEIILVEGMNDSSADSYAMICNTCKNVTEDSSNIDNKYKNILNESIWSEIPSVQVLSYRILNNINELWANEILEIAYLEEDLKNIAESTNSTQTHFDSNGVPLQKGDTVTLIKDLDVKGANMTAKRGTAVRNISLVRDNPEQIEGKVNGQSIIILTKFVKK